MAYNSLKSYWIWRRKKEAEEKAWRELGVDENVIAEIHDFDRIAYNSDDRFYKRLYDVGDFYEEIVEDNSKREITSVEQLLDEVENPAMYKILKKDERKNHANTSDEGAGILRKGHIGNLTYFQNFRLSADKKVREKLNKVR